MDKAFVQLCRSLTPPMNPRVMNGHLVHEIKDQERRIEETVRKAYDGLFNGRLRTCGLVRCSPDEAYAYAIKPKNSERAFEVAPSDTYLCKVPLELDGTHLLDLFFQLLVVDKGSRARLSKTMYTFRPSISDKVISPENKHIFVRVDQYRMNLMQLAHPVLIDNKPRMEAEVVWGQIHRSSKDKKQTGTKVKAKSCLVHYLLGHLGFTETFNRYCGYVPEYGDETTINDDTHPEDKWVIIKTAHALSKPSSCTEPVYVPTTLRIAVEKDKLTPRVKAYVTSVFYIVDSFPSTMTVDKLDHINSWKLALGYILFGYDLSLPRLISQVEEHFTSSNTYMDVESIHKLRQRGVIVDSFNDLLAYLSGEFNVLLGQGGNSSMYGKYLDTLRDTLDSSIKAINHTKYKLQELEAKGPNALTPNRIRDVIVRNHRPGAIYNNNKNSQLTEVVSSSTDHPYFKMTSRLGTNRSSPGNKAKKKSRLVLGAHHYVTSSQFMTGSLLNLSKHEPILQSHANPWILTDPDTGTILEDPTMVDELARVDAKLADKRGKK